jgi:hypothetical protein
MLCSYCGKTVAVGEIPLFYYKPSHQCFIDAKILLSVIKYKMIIILLISAKFTVSLKLQIENIEHEYTCNDNIHQ